MHAFSAYNRRGPYGPPKEALFLLASRAARHMSGSAVGGITDVVKHQETGLLVPEKDEGALARGILEVLADPSRAAGLAMAGLEYARQWFDWGQITDRLEEVYMQAIVDYRARRPRPHTAPVGARLQ